MKKKIICIFLPVLGLIIVYLLGYLIGRNMDNSNIILKSEVESLNPIAINNQGINAANIDEILIMKDTKLVVEKCIKGSDKIETKEMNIPTQMLGLNRDETLTYINNNLKDFTEKNELISSIMLVSFEADKLVIRKNVEIKEEETTTTISPEYRYMLKLSDNKITVYNIDTNEIFLETVIALDALDKDSITRLENGIQIKNIAELYRTLESFTT